MLGAECRPREVRCEYRGQTGQTNHTEGLSAGPLGVQQGVDAQPEPQNSQTEPPFEIEIISKWGDGVQHSAQNFPGSPKQYSKTNPPPPTSTKLPSV